MIEIDIPDISNETDIQEYINTFIPQKVAAVLDKIIAAATSPLAPEEKSPKIPAQNLPRIVHKGSLEEINEFFYKQGWAYGMPIMPPTEEAVKEMLKGTGLLKSDEIKDALRLQRDTRERLGLILLRKGCKHYFKHV